jgi:hypothetical protein
VLAGELEDLLGIADAIRRMLVVAKIDESNIPTGMAAYPS